MLTEKRSVRISGLWMLAEWPMQDEHRRRPGAERADHGGDHAHLLPALLVAMMLTVEVSLHIAFRKATAMCSASVAIPTGLRALEALARISCLMLLTPLRWPTARLRT